MKKKLQSVIKKKTQTGEKKQNKNISGSEKNHHSFKIQTLCQGKGEGQHTRKMRQAQGNSWCSNLPPKLTHYDLKLLEKS